MNADDLTERLENLQASELPDGFRRRVMDSVRHELDRGAMSAFDRLLADWKPWAVAAGLLVALLTGRAMWNAGHDMQAGQPQSIETHDRAIDLPGGGGSVALCGNIGTECRTDNAQRHIELRRRLERGRSEGDGNG